MCMAVYIAANSPLTLLPWNAASPQFYVAAVDSEDVAARGQFTEAHVYYAGSHEGCGCGFQYGQYPEFEDDERPLKRASLDQFATYLDSVVARVGPIRVFACWEGDQTAPVSHRRDLTPNALRRGDFFFLEREMSVVRSDRLVE